MKLEFHHINFVSEDVDRMHDFYTNVLGLDDIPQSQFPRTKTQGDKGFDGKIRFATEGRMQMHLAERSFDVAFPIQTMEPPLPKNGIRSFFMIPKAM